MRTEIWLFPSCYGLVYEISVMLAVHRYPFIALLGWKGTWST